jgi:hypothetical protein
MTTEARRSVYSVGPYVLNTSIHDLKKFVKLLPAKQPTPALNERLFEAPGVDFLGCEWAITIFSRGDDIYKIIAASACSNETEGEALFSSVRQYWTQQLGNRRKRYHCTAFGARHLRA